MYVYYNYCIYDVTLPFCTRPDFDGNHSLPPLNIHLMCHSNQCSFYVGYPHYRKVHRSENCVIQLGISSKKVENFTLGEVGGPNWDIINTFKK